MYVVYSSKKVSNETCVANNQVTGWLVDTPVAVCITLEGGGAHLASPVMLCSGIGNSRLISLPYTMYTR